MKLADFFPRQSAHRADVGGRQSIIRLSPPTVIASIVDRRAEELN